MTELAITGQLKITLKWLRGAVLRHSTRRILHTTVGKQVMSG